MMHNILMKNSFKVEVLFASVTTMDLEMTCKAEGLACPWDKNLSEQHSISFRTNYCFRVLSHSTCADKILVGH